MFTCLTSKQKPRFFLKKKKIHKGSYLISPPNAAHRGGSLFSFRDRELLLGEHFWGEDGLRDTAGIYFRDDIFPLSLSLSQWGESVCCQTLHSEINKGIWRGGKKTTKKTR